RDGLAAVGHHLVGVRIDLGHTFLHPFDRCRDIVGGIGDDIVRRLDACTDQREAGLVIVRQTIVDQGDAGAVEGGRKPRGGGQPRRTSPRNDDAGRGLLPWGLFCLGGQRGAQGTRGGHCQKTSTGGVGTAALHNGACGLCVHARSFVESPATLHFVPPYILV